MLKVIPLTPVIGAKIEGVDLAAPQDPDLIIELRRLLVRHKVIFSRDQSVDAGQHLAFGRRFGSILRFPGVNEEQPQHPGLQIIGSWRPPARRPDGGRQLAGRCW